MPRHLGEVVDFSIKLVNEKNNRTTVYWMIPGFWALVLRESGREARDQVKKVSLGKTIV